MVIAVSFNTLAYRAKTECDDDHPEEDNGMFHRTTTSPTLSTIASRKWVQTRCSTFEEKPVEGEQKLLLSRCALRIQSGPGNGVS